MATLNLSLISIPWRLISDTDTAYITSVAPYYEYVDNKKVDGIAGYRYTATLKNNKINRYKSLDVKIAGANPAITAEMLNENGGEIEATFTNFIGKMYVNRNENNKADISATATAINIVKKA